MRYLLLGATGDLARKKILPALARLATADTELEVVASSRRPWGDAEYGAFVRPALVAAGVAEPDAFLARVRYAPADHTEPASLKALAREVAPQSLIHLSIQPSAYAPVIEALGETGALGRDGVKLLIEKPFGRDEASARALDALITRYLPEERLYRIDHYLGKESVRALEGALAGEALTGVSVTLAETLDAQGRGAFYDETGVIRDVVQNHALEVLAASLAEGAGPEARLAALEKLSLAGPLETGVRLGQYQGYRETPGVAPDSKTPTAVELALSYASAAGPIPVTIYAGKALAEARQELVAETPPGPRAFSLAGDHAYDRLIREAAEGDRTHFPSLAEVLAAWQLLDPVLAPPTPSLAIYEPGSDF
ncbi:MAG: hypothetical protein KGH97_02035 [Patescibacteria group bacterium]|nr:hypothetical protein [Patescibacteria group bacterium]